MQSLPQHILSIANVTFVNDNELQTHKTGREARTT